MVCGCDKGVELVVRYHNDNIKKFKKFSNGDWIDLCAAESVEMAQFDFKLISLGFAMELPLGYEANIVPRGSTFKNFGVIQANHFGVIDNEYCGDNDVWRFPAIALRDTVIEEGDRICQFRLNKIQPDVKVKFTTRLTGKNRGGFGHTGVK